MLNGGVLGGTGTIGNNLFVNGGTLRPGIVVGRLTVGGGVVLSGNSTFAISLGGTVANSGYTQLFVGNTLSLSSALLSVQAVNGFTLAMNETFFIIDRTGTDLSQIGTFGNAPGGIYTDAAGDTFLVNYLAVDLDNGDHAAQRRELDRALRGARAVHLGRAAQRRGAVRAADAPSAVRLISPCAWSMSRVLWLVCCAVNALCLHVAAAQGINAPDAPSSQVAVASAATPAPVWVNIPSHIYHFPRSRWYGRTEYGKYASEADAIAEGDRAAKNEHLPLGFGDPVAPKVAAVSALPGPGTTPAPAPTVFLPAAAAPVALLPTPADTAIAPAPEPSPTAVVQIPPTVEPTEKLSVCLTAIAAQSDPARLSTLSTRAANPRLKRIMYYLAQARAGGADPGEVIDEAQRMNGSADTPRAPLVKASLLRNLKICDGLGLLTPENLRGMRRGMAPTVTRGPYTGQVAEVDHIVPLAVAGETDNELANLEMLPVALNRAKSAKVGDRQLALARKFREAGMISDATLANVEARYRPAGTEKYELQEP